MLLFTLFILTFVFLIAGIKFDKEREFVVISIVTVIAFFIYFCIFSLPKIEAKKAKIIKEHHLIIKKVKSILKQKTEHKNSKAYLYGVYSRHSYKKDKEMIHCYNKFHKIKETAQCLKAIH